MGFLMDSLAIKGKASIGPAGEVFTRSRIIGVRFLIVSILLLSGCSATLRLKMALQHSPEDIPMSGKTAAREFTDTSTFSFPLTAAWEYDASAGFGNGAPVIVGNTLITGTLQGEIHAVDMTTGKRIRYIKNFSPVSSSPVVFERYVIFGIETTEQNLISIDTDDGSVRWAKDAGGVASSPVITDGLLFVGGLDGIFRCFEAAYGTVKWKVDTGSPIRSSPCVLNDLVFCANSSGEVIAFSIFTGDVRWRYATGNAVFAGLTAADGKLFVGSRDSSLHILNSATGKVERKIPVGNKILSAPAVANGIVYVPTMEGALSAYSLSDGSEQWKFQAKSAINTTPVITPGAVFVVSLDQHLYALSPVDGTVLWKHNFESRIKTTPLVWKNSVIIAAEDKNIYCFR